MSRIYVRYGATEFDKDEFIKIQEKNKNNGLCCDKRSFDLWGSCFNELGSINWERLIGADIIEEMRKAVVAKIDKFMHKFDAYLATINLTEDEFFAKEMPEQEKILKACKAKTRWRPTNDQLSTWEQNREFTKLEIYEQMKLRCQRHRENAFFFIVDQKKILHIREKKDILPYLTQNNVHSMDLKRSICFDKIMADGYSGVELHHGDNYRDLHFNSVFKSWEVDAIAIWDPSCVMMIAPEIAHIARLAADVYKEDSDPIRIFDKHDPMMNTDYMIDWIQTHQDFVQEAIDCGIVTLDEVADIIKQKYDSSSGKQQGEIDPMDLEFDEEDLVLPENLEIDSISNDAPTLSR